MKLIVFLNCMQNSLLLLFSLSILSLSAQENLRATYNPISEDYRLLLNNHSKIQNDELLNHRIVDLVEVYTTDSVYKRKTEVHRSYFFPIIRAFGVRWKTIKYTREKMVGIVKHSYIPGKDSEHFTEYDVNHDLVPKLDKYIDLSYEAYQAQLNMFKSKKKDVKDKPPFIYPTENTDLTNYKIHCECTPNVDSRATLNNEFYPTIQPMNLEKHPNFGKRNPVVGLYGPFVLDCNHRCHPEIHPYEWFWWYDINPNKKHVENQKKWFVGFLRDVSNRFKHWSSSPRIGEASIPFIFPLDAVNKVIYVEHIEYDNFSEEDILKLEIEETTYNFSSEIINFKIDNNQISVVSNTLINDEGLRFYISNLNIDQENGYLTGKFNIAMAIRNVWAGSVSFEH